MACIAVNHSDVRTSLQGKPASDFTWRRGDGETGKQGDGEAGRSKNTSLLLSASPSLCESCLLPGRQARFTTEARRHEEARRLLPTGNTIRANFFIRLATSEHERLHTLQRMESFFASFCSQKEDLFQRLRRTDPALRLRRREQSGSQRRILIMRPAPDRRAQCRVIQRRHRPE